MPKIETALKLKLSINISGKIDSILMLSIFLLLQKFITLVIDFDFSIKGEATTLQASILNKRYKNDNTNQVVDIITGRFVNTKPNLNVKIFDAYINGVPQYSLSGFPLSFNDTGYFYILTDSGTNPIDNNNTTYLPIIANTNYGDVSFALNIQNEYLPLVFHNFSVSFSSNGINKCN